MDMGKLVSSPIDNHPLRLIKASEWLARAQDATDDGGVSYGWSLRGGWRPSYRETSGYIVPTFFDLAVHLSDPGWKYRAVRAAEWLVSTQNSDGSIANPEYGSDGIVFDTGQVLFGFVRAYQETNDPTFLLAAKRAGHWLVNVTDANRLWTRNEHFDTPHIYNTRTAWSLLELDRIMPDMDLVAVARANLEWAIEEQRNGYFQHCSFKPGAIPYTHTIAYATRGLLESGVILEEPRYLSSATSGAEAMRQHLREDGFIAGQISTEGLEQGNYCCLTGNCQLAICWIKLYLLTKNEKWKQAAIVALDYVISRQDVVTDDLDVHGAIAGSYPIWGRYAPFSYPNWATKFFLDAMMLRAQYLT